MSVTNLSQSPGTTGRATGGHSRTLTIDLWPEGQRQKEMSVVGTATDGHECGQCHPYGGERNLTFVDRSLAGAGRAPRLPG